MKEGFSPGKGIVLGNGTVSSLYKKDFVLQVPFPAFWICCLLPKQKNPVIVRDSIIPV